MSDGAEVDERVDFDEENYMEEMEDDVEEQIYDEGVRGGGDENEEDDEEPEYEDSGGEPRDKDQYPDADEGDTVADSVENEQNPFPIDENEKEKHDEILALPPHGSEVFIGGLPRDTCEDDLRELCEPIGDILEVLTLSCLVMVSMIPSFFVGKWDSKFAHQ